MEILEALEALNPNYDDHWTARGQPNVKVIGEMVENDKLTRSDLDAIAPDFHREMPVDKEAMLVDKMNTKQAKIASISKEINALEEKRKLMAQEAGFIGKQLDLERSNKPNSDIQNYLASQNRIREEKAAKMIQLRKSGIAEILKSVAKAPIDVALSKKKSVRRLQRRSATV